MAAYNAYDNDCRGESSGSSSCRRSSSSSSSSQTRETVDIIRIGHNFQYTIPSFSVVKIELRHAVISVWDGSLRKVKHLDVFLRESPDIASKVPCSIEILESCDVDVSMYYNYTNIILVP